MSIRLPPETNPEQYARLVAEAKEQLRRRIASLRRAIPPEARAARARAACARLQQDPAFESAECVCAYMPLRFELDVRPLIEAAHGAGKRVVLPRMVPGGSGALTLHAYAPDDELFENAMMVREPLADAPEVADDEVSLVIVPGLAFDAEGYRVGFGKGFYDRLLPRLRSAFRVGVGYDFQLLAEVPREGHDVPLHRFVSDARSLDCS